jgi:hypothetical protein
VSHIGVTNFGASLPEGLLENMTFYDAGYYNIGVRATTDDTGRGATDPFGDPLSFTDRAIMVAQGSALPFAPAGLPCGRPGFPPVCPS